MLLLWQNALKASVLDPYAPPNSHDLQFSRQVQDWTDSTIKSKWIAFYSQTTDRIYYRAGLQWRVYARYSGTGVRGRYSQQAEICRELPTTADRLASLSPRGAMFKIENSHVYSFSPTDKDPAKYDPSEETFSCIADAFDASIMSQRILIDDVTLPADGCQAIAEAIIKGNGLAVSDGSFDPDISTTNETSGFQLAATKDDKEDRLNGVNWVPGSPIDQSAYRSELTGIAGILATTEIIVKHFGIVTGGITIALDGESALDEACGEWPLSIDQASYDLLQEIRNRVSELPIDVKWRWVEGHQKERQGEMMMWMPWPRAI